MEVGYVGMKDSLCGYMGMEDSLCGHVGMEKGLRNPIVVFRFSLPLCI